MKMHTYDKNIRKYIFKAELNTYLTGKLRLLSGLPHKLHFDFLGYTYDKNISILAKK
jgi:hypothetical protein